MNLIACMRSASMLEACMYDRGMVISWRLVQETDRPSLAEPLQTLVREKQRSTFARHMPSRDVVSHVISGAVVSSRESSVHSYRMPKSIIHIVSSRLACLFQIADELQRGIT